MKQILPSSIPKEATLPTPWSWPCSSQSCGTATVCCLCQSVCGTWGLWYLVTGALADWDSLESCRNSPSLEHRGSLPLATLSAGGSFGLYCTLSCPSIHGMIAEAKLLAQWQHHSLTHCWPFPASVDLWASLQLSQCSLLSVSLSISNYNGRSLEAGGLPLPILWTHMCPNSGG